MAVEESLRSKSLYKIFLILIKIIPMFMAFLCLLNTVLSCFGIDLVILSYIGSTSISTLLFMYLASYIFKFCKYHRMFIHYLGLTWIINILDYYIGIPISTRNILLLYFIISGIFLFLILYFYVKTNKKPSCINNR